jgi:hypothetical protein
MTLKRIVLAIGLFTQVVPVLQGTSPEKVWDLLSVAYNTVSGQEPGRIGHFQTL